MNFKAKAQMCVAVTMMSGVILGLAGCGLTGSAPPQATNQTTNATNQTAGGNNTSSNDTNQVAVNVTVSNNTTNTTGTGNNASSGNQTSANQAPGASGSGLALQTASIGQASVQVPQGWTRASIGSGDWSGWRYQNPKDPNEQVLVAFSGCIGCYTGADGKPSPVQAIPEQNATNVQLQSKGTSATYTIPSAKNPYNGSGLLTVTTDLSGYGYVEVYAPSKDASLVQSVLNSFKVTG